MAAVEGLKVSNIKTPDICINLPRTYTQAELPLDSEDIATNNQLKKWKYLHHIIEDVNIDKDTKIGVLIGANCPTALQPHDVIASQDGGPYAVKTQLGWCIVGPVNGTSKTPVKCNRIAVHQVDNNVGKHYFEIKEPIIETDIQEQMKSMYNLEFAEITTCQKKDVNYDELSVEDRKFLVIVNQGTKLVNGKYQVPLLFSTDIVIMPNNRNQAWRRFKNLQRRFEKDPNFKSLYFKSFKDMFEKGYAETTTESAEGKSWYIPHQGVIHPSKPNKLRIVLDCSAEYAGKCINKELLNGPDLTNHIVGILLRFRKEQITLTADIEGMFYQVKLPPSQRSFFKFLWFKDNDITKDVVDYQMTSHVFGGTSSPSCSNFALRKTAEDNKDQYPAEVTRSLKRSFYVDDLLKSMPSVAEIAGFAASVKSLCNGGVFNLTKFVSNSKEALTSIGIEDCKLNTTAKDLLHHDTPQETALGMRWSIDIDELQIQAQHGRKTTFKKRIVIHNEFYL